MSLNHLSNTEVALKLAKGLQEWRISPDGAGMSQRELSQISGIGLTPLKRFEKTGAITLRNLIALLRALELLDNLEAVIPATAGPGPLELLQAERKKKSRARAPRNKKEVPDG